MAQQHVQVAGKPIPASDVVFDHLSNGVTDSVTGDYSLAAEIFKYACKEGSQRLYLTSLVIYIEDVGKFAANSYGNSVTLTNGIHIGLWDADDTEIQHIDGDHAVFVNPDWAALTGNFTQYLFQIGNEAAGSIWEFGAPPQTLALTSGQYIGVQVEDDFTGLVKHHFTVKGYYA